jgi:hypothetical protein
MAVMMLTAACALTQPALRHCDLFNVLLRVVVGGGSRPLGQRRRPASPRSPPEHARQTHEPVQGPYQGPGGRRFRA